jgi:hypothetical protein
MHNIKLNNEQTLFLLSIAESGMGYHNVDLVLKNNIIIQNVIILNCEFAQTEELISSSDIVEIIPLKK